MPCRLATAQYKKFKAGTKPCLIGGVSDGTRTHDFQCHKLTLYQLNYTHHMARPKRFELLAYCLEGSCSIRLSYGRILFPKRRLLYHTY